MLCQYIANKADKFKGQFLMMFVDGQGKAILDEFEGEKYCAKNILN